MTTHLVSVIIVHYNTPQLTLACVESVLSNTSDLDYEVIVVDNASTVGNIEILKTKPRVTVIRSDMNLGFAGGNNLGIALSKGEYVLLLNSDCELKNDAIRIALQYYKQNEGWIGALSSALQYPNGKPQYPTGRFPSIKRELIALFRLTKPSDSEWLEKYYLGDRLPAEKESIVDWIWGAFFLISRKKLNALSGHPLPDTFFLYYEDVQWCYELYELGFRNYYYPKAQVIHHLSGSGGGSEESKYWQKIQPNEYEFLQLYKGKMYCFFYYLIKGAFHISLRKPQDRDKGIRFMKIAFGKSYK